MKKVLLNDIILILSKCTKVPFNKIDKNFKSSNNAEWDSLSSIRIFLEIEKFYKIKMDKSKIYELDSVKSILSYLTKIKKK